jgi:hypothetical protein
MSEELDVKKRVEECLAGSKMEKELPYLAELVYYKIKDSKSLEEKLEWLSLRIKLFEKEYILTGSKGCLVDALFAPVQLMLEYGHRPDIDLLNINELAKRVLSSISHLDYKEVKSMGSSWQTLNGNQLRELAFLRNCIARLYSLSDLLPSLDNYLKEEIAKWLELKGKILR